MEGRENSTLCQQVSQYCVDTKQFSFSDMKITLKDILFKYALKKRFVFLQRMHSTNYSIWTFFYPEVIFKNNLSVYIIRMLFMPRAEERSTAASNYPLLSALPEAKNRNLKLYYSRWLINNILVVR